MSEAGSIGDIVGRGRLCYTAMAHFLLRANAFSVSEPLSPGEVKQ